MKLARWIVRVALLAATFAPAAAAQDQLVRQALTRIEKYEALEPSLQSGDRLTANRYILNLKFAKKRLGAAYDKKTTHWVSAARRYNELMAKINAKAAGKPAPKGSKPPAGAQPAAGSQPPATPKPVNRRELQMLNSKIQRAFQNMKSSRVGEFADAGRVQRIKEQIVGFRTRIRGLPKGDPNVVIVRENIDSMQKLLDACLKRVEELRAPPGAVEKIQKLTEFYRQMDLLQPLEEPMEPERVAAWAKQVHAFKAERMPEDLKWIDSVRGRIGIELQPWQRLRGLVASSWPLKLNQMLARSQAVVDGGVIASRRTVTQMLEIDPEDEHIVRNTLLGQGAMARVMGVLADAQRAFRVAKAYDTGLKRKTDVDYDAELKRVAAAREHVRKCAQQGLSAVRMPKAASEDKKLLAVAKEVLARKKYGCGKPLRVVINSELQRKEKREGSITPGTVSATISVYHYVWDQFQVTTVEREGETYWMYANWLRFYHKGGSTTPTGHWIMSGRFRISPILEANLDR